MNLTDAIAPSFYENKKQIKGFENYYIDKNGIVYSCQNGIIKIKSPFKNHNGYLRVTLWNKGKQKKFFIHRLVAENFVENEKPDIYNSVDHIDKNIFNNNYKNLRWTTIEKNSGSAKAKLNKKQVEYIKNNYERGKGTKLSKKFNCDLSMVVKIAKGKAYTWVND